MKKHSSRRLEPGGTVMRRHTYVSPSNNTLGDLFAVSMHTTDPSSAFDYDILEFLLDSPTSNDMYTESFHGDDVSSSLGSLSLLYPDVELGARKEDDCQPNDSDRSSTKLRKLPSSKKKKKNRKSKRQSTSSEETKSKSQTKRRSKTKSQISKSKPSKTPEPKTADSMMMKKLEKYEEILEEERRLLQKERGDIARERESLEIKIFELESRLDEIGEENGLGGVSCHSDEGNTDEALRIENGILQRRVQRQNKIILQLGQTSNPKKNKETLSYWRKKSSAEEVHILEQALLEAKGTIVNNEKVIKGQRLTIDRMRKELSGSASDINDRASKLHKSQNRPLPISLRSRTLGDDGTASFAGCVAATERPLSLSSMGGTKQDLCQARKDRKEGDSSPIGQIRSWVNFAKK